MTCDKFSRKFLITLDKEKEGKVSLGPPNDGKADYSLFQNLFLGQLFRLDGLLHSQKDLLSFNPTFPEVIRIGLSLSLLTEGSMRLI